MWKWEAEEKVRERGWDMDSASHAGFEEGGKRPQVRECKWPREGTDSPWSVQKGTQPAATWVLDEQGSH